MSCSMAIMIPRSSFMVSIDQDLGYTSKFLFIKKILMEFGLETAIVLEYCIS